MSERRRESQGILQVALGAPTEAGVPGLHRLELEEKRDGLLYLPRLPAERSHPLVVLLHGAGADAQGIVNSLLGEAERHGCALLVPESRGLTWDFLRTAVGLDVRFMERAMQYTAARCRIEPSEVAIAGFSDGASYALTVGVINGDLFKHIMAFSPGFMAPTRAEGKPRIFVSHGVHDEVLPIDRCSRRLVPRLEEAGYEVSYREFDGPHTVPAEIVSEAMRWFLGAGESSVGSAAIPE